VNRTFRKRRIEAFRRCAASGRRGADDAVIVHDFVQGMTEWRVPAMRDFDFQMFRLEDWKYDVFTVFA